MHSAVLIAIRSVILLLPAVLVVAALLGIGIVTLLPAVLVVAVLLPVGIVALLITALLPVLAIARILAVGLGASSITKRVIERCGWLPMYKE